MYRVVGLAATLEGLGLTIKVNSALRASGAELIGHLKKMCIDVMADYKLVDISETLKTDGKILREFNPKFLTVMCNAGIDGMIDLREALPETEVLGVSVLTSLNEEECQAIYSQGVRATVLNFARYAQLAGLGGLVCSAAEAVMLKKRRELSLLLNTPAVRPLWSLVDADDQEKSRVMTPTGYLGWCRSHHRGQADSERKEESRWKTARSAGSSRMDTSGNRRGGSRTR